MSEKDPLLAPPRTFDAFFASFDQNETVDNLYCLSAELELENIELRELVDLITIQEESDSGRIFYPNGITSCRAMDGERMGEIAEKYRSTPHISTEEYHGE